MGFQEYHTLRGFREKFNFPVITFYNSQLKKHQKRYIRGLLNKRATDIFPHKTYISIFYDPDQNRIGIQKTGQKGSLKINYCSAYKASSINFDGFAKFFDIPLDYFIRKSYEITESRPFYIIDLNKPLKQEDMFRHSGGIQI